MRFTVTDAAGKPAQAALGIVVVDEAVYAMQDMQPGLEMVYFTLQEELLHPKASIPYPPSERLEVLALQPGIDAPKQQIAEALLTAVRPKPPAPGMSIPPSNAVCTMERRHNRSACPVESCHGARLPGPGHSFLKADLVTDLKKMSNFDIAP